MTKILLEQITPAEADFIATLNDKLNAFVTRGSFDPPNQQANAAGLTQAVSTAARDRSSMTRNTRDDRDAIAARRSLIGHMNLDAPSNLPRSDDHITGKVGGKEKIKPALAWVDPEIGLERQKGVAILQPTTLFIPCTRPMRIANKDDVTTFHFSHEAISRSADVTANNASQNTKSAAEHCRYLERDGAIAMAPISAGIAAAQAIYLERGSVQARSENGEPILFTNIASDFANRQEFWTQVEAHERKPGNDKMTLHPNRNRTLWDEVLNDPDCPSSFKKSYEAFDQRKGAKSKTQSFATGAPGTNKKIAAVLRKYNTDQSAWGCAFSDARGGRIQMRIAGELPNEISHDGRVRIVRAFAQEFEKRNLPYQAVMHEPDHRNDEKNWHFHVAYHDRPAKRFAGRLDDLIPPANLTAATKVTHAIAEKALAVKKVRDQIGKWDFSVAYTRRDEKSRHTTTTYPFAQAKVRECNKSDFPKKLRVRLAELINDELADAGVLRRVSAETYVKIGIQKTPDQHLGPARNELEKMGVATARGIENERNDWQYRIGQAVEKRNQDFDDCQSKLRHFRDDLKRSVEDVRVPPFTANQLALHAAACDEYAQLRAAQRRLEFVSYLADQTVQRAKSRAEKLRKDMTKMLAAVKNGKASERDVDNEASYEKRLGEAEDHLLLVDHEFAPISERATEIGAVSYDLTQKIAELDHRIRSAGFVFCCENQLDKTERDLQSRFAALGQTYTPSMPPEELSSVDNLVIRQTHVLCAEWQIEADQAAVAEQAARELLSAQSRAVSLNDAPAQSPIAPISNAIPTQQHVESEPANADDPKESALPIIAVSAVPSLPSSPPELAADTPASTPPAAMERPVQSEQAIGPVVTPNIIPPKPEIAKQKPDPSSAQPIKTTAPLGGMRAKLAQAAREQLAQRSEAAAHERERKPYPVNPSPPVEVKASDPDRVAPTSVLRVGPSRASDLPPREPMPAKENDYSEFGVRDLGNRSASYSDPSTNPDHRPVQPIAPDAVPPPAAPDVVDPMDREWAKAVDRQLAKVRRGKAHLLHIHPSVRTWFIAQRDDNADARLAAALAIARDRDAFDLILKIPNGGVVPESFGRPTEQGATAQTTPSLSQSKGINRGQAPQYDRGRGIED